MVGKKLGILFLASVILSFFAGYFSSRVLPDLGPRNTSDIFDFITSHLEEHYLYDIDDLEKNLAFVRSIEAIAEAYAALNNDPYTRVISSSLSTTPGSDETFIGIGVSFAFEGNDLRIGNVNPSGAAAGLLYPNDIVIGIRHQGNDVLFETLASTDAVLSYLSGSLGDTRTLIVENPDGIITFVDVTYQAIETPSVFGVNLLEPNIGYIRITRFSAPITDVSIGTAGLFQNLLNTLESTVLAPGGETKTLILDLRDNPGGSLSALHNQNVSSQVPGIAQQLIRRNLERPIFSMSNRKNEITNYYGNLTQPKGYQIAVLVNEQSASAAEVLAAALMEEGYTLYGMPTFGKGVYQNQIRITDIGSIRYSLIFTEGSWFYGDNLNVATTPLQVTPIPQTGYYALGMPVYQGLVTFDQVSLSLRPYQSFFNLYYNLSGGFRLRTDGYFDLKTDQVIRTFQAEHAIPVTGSLDLLTSRKVHDLYMEKISDMTYDMQLAQLVELLRG